MCSVAPSRNSKRDLSLGAHRRQGRRPAHPSSVNLNNSNSNSNRRAGRCSVVPRLRNHKLEDRCLGILSSLHNPRVDCLEIRRHSSSPLRVDLSSGPIQINQLRVVLCLGVPQPSQLRVADCLVRNSPPNNKVDRFSAVHNSRHSSKEALSLATPSNPALDRRHRSLGRPNNNPLPVLHCLAALNSRKQDPPCSEIPNPQYSVPRLSLSSNSLLWEQRSVRSPQLAARLQLIQLLVELGELTEM